MRAENTEDYSRGKKLPEDWTVCHVKDLAVLTNGSAFNEDDWTNKGLPIIRIQNLNGSREFNFFDGDLSNHVVVEPKDLLFSWSGNRGTSFGPFVWNGTRGVLNQHIFKITLKDGVEPGFLYQALQCVTAEIEQRAHGGTGIVHVRKSELESFPILLPSQKAQRKIVKLLSTIEDAIEAARAVIEQTRRLKATLLQDLLTNGLPGRHSKFKRTKYFDRIPNDWSETCLGALLAEPIRNGYSPVSPKLPTGHWVMTLSVVSLEGYQSTGVKPAPLGDPNVQSTIVKPSDILVSRSNTRELVGLAGIYDGRPSPCSYSDLLMRVRVQQSKVINEYTLLCLLSWRSRNYFAKTSRGTSGSMKKIDRQILESLPIPLPSLEEQNKIVRAIESIDQRLKSEANHLSQLIFAKKTLGQGLLTGRILVPVRCS